MEDTTSDIFIRNDPEASIFFRDAYPTGGPVASLEGFPFPEFDVELSVPLIAQRESWCLETASEFFIRILTNAPGTGWSLFPNELRAETRKEWFPEFDHNRFSRGTNLQGRELEKASRQFYNDLLDEVNAAWRPDGSIDPSRFQDCMKVSRSALLEARVPLARRQQIEEARLLMQFRWTVGGEDPLIKLSDEESEDRRQQAVAMDLLRGELHFAQCQLERQTELNGRYLAPRAQASTTAASIQILQDELTRIRGEGPRNIGAGGGGACPGSPSPALGSRSVGSGLSTTPSSLAPSNPLKLVGDNDKRSWNVFGAKEAMDQIQHGYCRHRAVSKAVLQEVTSTTGDHLAFDVSRAKSFHSRAAESHATSFGRAPVFPLVGNPCIHSVNRTLKLPVLKELPLLTRWYNGALVELNNFSESEVPLVQWTAELFFQSIRNIQLLLDFWGVHFAHVLDDLLVDIMDAEVTRMAPVSWLISLVQLRFAEYWEIMRNPVYTAELAARPGYPPNLGTCAHAAQLLKVTVANVKQQALQTEQQLKWQGDYNSGIVPIPLVTLYVSRTPTPAAPAIDAGANTPPRPSPGLKRKVQPVSIEDLQIATEELKAEVKALTASRNIVHNGSLSRARGSAPGPLEPNAAARRKAMCSTLRSHRSAKHHICTFNLSFLANLDRWDCRGRGANCKLTHFDDLNEVSRARVLDEWTHCAGYPNGALPVDILSGPKQDGVLAALTLP